jgi:ferredoxin
VVRAVLDRPDQVRAPLRVGVDTGRCEGCGYCGEVAPDLFELDGAPPALVRVDPVPHDAEGRAREAALLCPTTAILVEDAPVSTP